MGRLSLLLWPRSACLPLLRSAHSQPVSKHKDHPSCNAAPQPCKLRAGHIRGPHAAAAQQCMHSYHGIASCAPDCTTAFKQCRQFRRQRLCRTCAQCSEAACAARCCATASRSRCSCAFSATFSAVRSLRTVCHVHSNHPMQQQTFGGVHPSGILIAAPQDSSRRCSSAGHGQASCLPAHILDRVQKAAPAADPGPAAADRLRWRWRGKQGRACQSL